jgi:hypothetical protein
MSGQPNIRYRRMIAAEDISSVAGGYESCGRGAEGSLVNPLGLQVSRERRLVGKLARI